MMNECWRDAYELQERWKPCPSLQDWEAFIEDANQVSRRHDGCPLIKGLLCGIINQYWDMGKAGD